MEALIVPPKLFGKHTLICLNINEDISIRTRMVWHTEGHTENKMDT